MTAPTLKQPGNRTMLAADHYVIVAGFDASGNPVPLLVDSDGRPLAPSVSSAPVASEIHIGEVSTPASLVDVTLSLDTSAYASGDVLADTQVVTDALRVSDGTAILQSLVLVDEDDQKVALDLLFFSGSGTLGTENSAPSISDANARNFLGKVSIVAADYSDLGGVSVAIKTGLGLLVKAATGTRNIYVAALNGTGTPTYTASGLKLRLGFLW